MPITFVWEALPDEPDDVIYTLFISDSINTVSFNAGSETSFAVGEGALEDGFYLMVGGCYLGLGVSEFTLHSLVHSGRATATASAIRFDFS